MKNYTIAEKILTAKELAWTQNHLAFSHQQALLAAKKEKNADKVEEHKIAALKYCQQAIQQYERLEDADAIKITAFAYCVKALTEYEAGQLNIAVASYRFALDLYEKYSLLDDQYARAKNRYAQFLAEQKNDEAARFTFEELEKYWSQNEDNKNPYPARFYVSHAAYLSQVQPENIAMILEKYKKAYDILRVIEGEESSFTKDIYKKVVELNAQVKPYSNSAALCQFKPQTTANTTQESQLTAKAAPTITSGLTRAK